MKEPLDGVCGKAMAPQQDTIKEEPDNVQVSISFHLKIFFLNSFFVNSNFQLGNF